MRSLTRWMVTGVVVAVLALAVAGAAVVYLRSGDATSAASGDGPRCYSEASTDGYFTTIAISRIPGIEDAQYAETVLGACEGLWRRGMLVRGADGVQSPSGSDDFPVPPLVACGIDGVIAVFPGPDSTCARLGLRSFE